MSARGKIFDGLGAVKAQKEDPEQAAKENWDGPRAGFHVSRTLFLFYVFLENIFANKYFKYAKTLREKVIIWKTNDDDDLSNKKFY